MNRSPKSLGTGLKNNYLMTAILQRTQDPKQILDDAASQKRVGDNRTRTCKAFSKLAHESITLSMVFDRLLEFDSFLIKATV